ncbi:ATP/GTP-binding protein, partial [Micromonospora craterilacus]
MDSVQSPDWPVAPQGTLAGNSAAARYGGSAPAPTPPPVGRATP